MKRDDHALRKQAIPIGLFLVYFILLALATTKHTFWRDEAQAWLIARDSPNLRLLFRNLRYEGHPPLWHMVLLPLTRISWNPNWMKLPNFVFAIFSAALVLTDKRLSLFTRTGITFSYYLLFEYAVITRNYMLGIVLLLAATRLISERSSQRFWAVPVLLSLSSISSGPALVLSLGLLAVFLKQELVLRKLQNDSDAENASPWVLPLGALLVAVFAIASVLFIRPPADTGVFLEFPPDFYSPARIILKSGHFILKAFLPIPVANFQFWGRCYLDTLSPHLRIVTEMLGLVLAIALIVYLRKVSARYFFVLCSAILVANILASDRETMRHVGWLFICFVLALILDQQSSLDDPLPSRPPWQRWTLRALFTAQIYSGLFAIAVSLTHIFSASQLVANYLKSSNLDRGAIVFEPDLVSSSILAYLQQPTFYNLETHSQASFIIWNRQEFLARRIPEKEELRSAAQGKGVPVLVLEQPLTAEQQQALDIHRIASFGAAIDDIQFYLYR